MKIVDADAWDTEEDYAGNAASPHTLYDYDDINRKIATSYPGHNPASDPGDSDYDKKEFAYDAAGKLTKSTDQKGEYVAFAFDLAGRLETRKYYNISDVLQDTDTFTSDLSARPLTAEKERYNNTVTFTYDVAGRAATETLTTGGANYEVAYGYDYGSRLIELTYPDDTVVERGYTKRHELDDIDYESAAVADRVFDDGGRLATTTFGNSLVETRGYTRDDNMVTSIGITGVTGFGYSYDANKNRTAQTDSVQTAHAWTADYDDEDRLTDFDKSTYNQHDQTWTLSNEGDWDSTTLGGTQETRTHDDVHQLTQRGATNLSYDAKGNLTQDKNGRNFTWDQDNKLSAADLDGNETDDATYTYDALGRRVTKVYNGLTTLYARAGWQTLAEYEDSGSGYQLARKFVYGDYLDEPLMMIRLVEEKKTVGTGTETESEIGVTPATQMTEQKYYYHANANYNIAAMTNQNGTMTEQYRYSAYGLPTVIQTANIGNPFYFTGKRYDAELTWYDYNFRPFEPEQGRFSARDKEYYDGHNSYTYVLGAPLDSLDPLGLWKIRRNRKERAWAIAEKGDTFAKLAGKIKLDSPELPLWAIGEVKMVPPPKGWTVWVHNLSVPVSKKFLDSEVCPGESVTIPNKMIMVFGERKWVDKFPTSALAAFRKAMFALGAKYHQDGFLVESLSSPTVAQAKKALGSPDLYAFAFAGHGIEGAKGAIALTLGESGHHLLSDKYVHHRIAFLGLFACSSAVPANQRFFDPKTTRGRNDISEWEVNVSSQGTFLGFTEAINLFTANKYKKKVHGGADYVPVLKKMRDFK